MITVSSLHELHKETGSPAAVVACGVFDGVHRGHQKLLQALLDMARRFDALPVALTFEPHPRTVLAFDEGPPRLTTCSQKVEFLHSYGAEAVVVLDFTRELASLTAEAFLQSYLLSTDISLRGIVVGQHWRFGSGGKGNLEFLSEAGQKHGFIALGVDEESSGGEPVSSTRIRHAISKGDLENAAEMLGRPYSVRGTVIRGKGIAGSRLERATANLDPKELLLPPPGVYAAWARRRTRINTGKATSSELRDAIVYTGHAPTVHGTDSEAERTLEVHLFNEAGAFYGQDMEVFLLSRIRRERCFASLGELKRQIDRDVKQARDICRACNPSSIPAFVFHERSA